MFSRCGWKLDTEKDSRALPRCTFNSKPCSDSARSLFHPYDSPLSACGGRSHVRLETAPIIPNDQLQCRVCIIEFDNDLGGMAMSNNVTNGFLCDSQHLLVDLRSR